MAIDPDELTKQYKQTLLQRGLSNLSANSYKSICYRYLLNIQTNYNTEQTYEQYIEDYITRKQVQRKQHNRFIIRQFIKWLQNQRITPQEMIE